MARIVSGFQTQGGDWDGGAVLRGFKSGQDARLNEEQNRRANEGVEMERQRLAFQIQQALAEQMASDEAAQQRQAAAQQQGVEVGKAGRLQQFAQRAQAGQVHPGQKFVEKVIGARGRLKDPKALAMFDESVKSLLETQKAAKKRKAFDETLRMAEMDADVFPPEMVQGLRQQADAGGDLDSLIKQTSEHRLKAASQQRVRAENEGLFTQAEEMIKAAPPGEGKKMAETLLYAARQPSQLQIEGKGSEVLQGIQEALLPQRSQWGKAQQSLGYDDPKARMAASDDLTSQLGTRPSEEQLREYMRFINPALPAPQPPSVARASPVKVDAVIRSALKGGALKTGADHKGVAEALKAAGIPLTAEVLQMARATLQEYTNTARASGGAERGR